MLVMIIKNPSILLAKCGNLYSLPTGLSGSSTSLKQERKSTRQQRCSCKNNKSYATIADDSGDHQGHRSEEQHVWPSPPKGHHCPTPYQIFAIKDTATYSKSRFYQLVKLYHPDRNSVANDANSHAVKTERYRLIVAAHTILSDPTRRSAYDRFGAGWDGKADVGGHDTWYHPSPHHRPGPFTHSWNNPDDPIWRNATWEDWERFYARRAQENGNAEGVRRPHQSPLYLQNSYFFLMVLVLALMGSTANYSRAQDAGAYFIEQRDIIHDRAAKELRQARQDATQSRSKDDRIEWFVRNRGATLGLAGSDAETLRQEKVDRLLPDREVCRSEEIAEKD